MEILDEQLTHEEVTGGEGEEGEEGQRILKGDGVLHCQKGHAENQGVHAGAGGVDAEHDEVAHVLLADAVPGEKAVVVPLQNHLPAQFTEVAVVEEVVRVHFVRAVRRAHGDRAVAGAGGGISDSHDVVPQRVQHGEEEERRVEGGGGPERGVRHGEDGREEEAEVENEGDRRGREEVDGGHHIEEPQLQHPGEHVCEWRFWESCRSREEDRQISCLSSRNGIIYINLFLPTSILLTHLGYKSLGVRPVQISKWK